MNKTKYIFLLFNIFFSISLFSNEKNDSPLVYKKNQRTKITDLSDDSIKNIFEFIHNDKRYTSTRDRINLLRTSKNFYKLNKEQIKRDNYHTDTIVLKKEYSKTKFLNKYKSNDEYIFPKYLNIKFNWYEESSQGLFIESLKYFVKKYEKTDRKPNVYIYTISYLLNDNRDKSLSSELSKIKTLKGLESPINECINSEVLNELKNVEFLTLPTYLKYCDFINLKNFKDLKKLKIDVIQDKDYLSSKDISGLFSSLEKLEEIYFKNHLIFKPDDF